MTDLLTSAQMRNIEQQAISFGTVTGLELMERAGRGVVDAVFKHWPELAKSSYRAVVLCGPGNNGGDGFVVARMLADLGWQVAVHSMVDEEKLIGDTAVNRQRYQGPLTTIAEINELFPEGFELLVDALFGTGLSRSVEGLEQIFDAIAGADSAKIVSVDVPTGVCADSGVVFAQPAEGPSFAVTADLTVTFHSAKLGHYLGEGPERAGKLVTKSIGLVSDGAPCELAEPPALGDISKGETSHKFDHGHALVLSGGIGRGGAARLAARGALRIGAGLVTVACSSAATSENASQLNAIMLKATDSADDLREVLEDKRLNAICIGPGLGERASTAALVETALLARRATVVDADGLSAFAHEPAALFEVLHAACVMTPHGGEFARLFPDIAERLNGTAYRGPAYSKVDATRDAAKRAGCTILYKGRATVIASPNGDVSINAAMYSRSAPQLASAGSGDVLAGFVTGLLARGFAPKRAAELASWLHVECARSFGVGLIAEDLPEELPKVFRRLQR